MTGSRMRKFGTTAALAAIVVGTATTGVAAAQGGAPATNSYSLHEEAERALKKGEFLGLSAGLRDGRDRTEVNVGVGDLRTGDAPPAHARFRIASTTKTFVTTALLQLAGEGRLSLDDTVEKWLPGLVRGNGNDGSRITLRNLLQNTSGLHNYAMQLGLDSEERFEEERWTERTPRELVELAVAQKPSFPPADKDDPEPDWEYSNTNFVLAGMVIKAATGNDWRTEVKERIIRPLGLKDTYAPGRATDVRGPHARAYQRFEDSTDWVDTTEFTPTWADAAGELVSSHRDLDRFFTALLGGKLLGAEELKAMQTTVPVSEEFTSIWPGARYGLGLISHPLSCGGKFWAHHGDLPGSTIRVAFAGDGEVSVTSTATGVTSGQEVQADEAAMRLLDRSVCESR